MNYQFHYDNLITTRKLLNRSKSDGIYYEKHHIIMKSMGGTNDKKNLILLTAREHFLAHWLLWRIYKNRDSAFAFKLMCDFNSKRKNVFSARMYAESREASLLATSKLNLGKIHSIQTKELIRKNSKVKKTILQFSLEDIFIKKWNSIREIERELEFSHNSISCCCNDKSYGKTAYGFIWKFDETIKNKNISK